MAMLVVSLAPAKAGKKIDQTEVSTAEFSQVVKATGYITKAEQTGGVVDESGWVTKPDRNWRLPYGVPSDTQELAVHITFDEAEFFANGKVSACSQGKNGSTMAIQKCAMIIGDCKVSMAIYDGILSTEEIIASLYSIKSR